VPPRVWLRRNPELKAGKLGCPDQNRYRGVTGFASRSDPKTIKRRFYRGECWLLYKAKPGILNVALGNLDAGQTRRKSPPSVAPLQKKKETAPLQRGFTGTPLKPIEEIKIWSNMSASQQWNRSLSGPQENTGCVWGNLRAPYNNRFDRNWCGRHALCSVGL
jgi:hypothetical protein